MVRVAWGTPESLDQEIKREVLKRGNYRPAHAEGDPVNYISLTFPGFLFYFALHFMEWGKYRIQTQKTQKTIKGQSPSFFYLSVFLITKLILIYYNQPKLCKVLSLLP